MFKDSYFQSSEILQNAVKCIDYVEQHSALLTFYAGKTKKGLG